MCLIYLFLNNKYTVKLWRWIDVNILSIKYLYFKYLLCIMIINNIQLIQNLKYMLKWKRECQMMSSS